MSPARPLSLGLLLGSLLLVGASPAALGADSTAAQQWLAAAQTPQTASAPADVPAPAECEKPVPLSFDICYMLVSDYVFRGVNYSEYPGEGRERPNHQLSTSLEYDLKQGNADFGTIGTSFWFEWYGGQEALNPPNYDGHLQEVDYQIFYRKEIPETRLTAELGLYFYTYPALAGDAHKTTEWYVLLSYDDADLWKRLGLEGVSLNPTLLYAMDVDDAKGGQWIELGISHDFSLADYGFGALPVLKDLTITPSMKLGIDHRYLAYYSLDPANTGDPRTRLGLINYGLEVSYNLSNALSMPAKYGAITLKGFLNYSQALERQVLDDQFYGGLMVDYSW